MTDNNNSNNSKGGIVRFAIAGNGLIAEKNAVALKTCELTELVYIGARNVDKAKTFAEKYCTTTTTTIEEKNTTTTSNYGYGTLDDIAKNKTLYNIHAVYFALPTLVRAKYVLQAINVGLHVLVEKPIAINVAEAKEIINAAKRMNVIYMDGTMWMQATRTKHIYDILHIEKRLGSVQSTIIGFSAKIPIEMAESGIRGKPDIEPLGAIGDMCWYTAGMSMFCFNYHFPVKVTATSTSYLPNTGNTYHCHAMLEFLQTSEAEDDNSNNNNNTKNKTTIGVAIFDGGFNAPLRQNVDIVCERGWIRLNDYVNPPVHTFDSFAGPSTARPTQYEILDDTKQGNNNGIIITGTPEIVNLPQEESDGDEESSKLPIVRHVHEVEMMYNFCNAILHGDNLQNPMWIKSSLSTMAIIDGLMESSKNNGQSIIVQSPF